MRRTMPRTRLLVIALSLAALAAVCACNDDGPSGPGAQDEPFVVTYTFTSGPKPDGDGITWPPSPPGLIDDTPSNTSYSTDESVVFLNDIGNPVYFNDTTLLPDDASVGNGIVDDCLWGNPRPINFPIVETFRVDLPTQVDSIAFDFAWALGGATVTDSLELALSPSLGGGEAQGLIVRLPDTWDAGAPYQNSLGRSGHVELSLEILANQYDVHLTGIRSIFVFLSPVSDEGTNGAFAIDNLTLAKF
ncbi:MAG: hypothetical protein H6694_03435 [Candidatus Latescibacteria bacterium]|nr:hypothetical protein [Candidatus Latescibacterota bacterium]